MMSDQVGSAVTALMDVSGRGLPYQAELDNFHSITSRLPLNDIRKWEREIQFATYRSDQYEKHRPTGGLMAGAAPIIPWFDLFSGNGYRRERALRETLAAAPNSFLMLAMLRQLNHWVPNVRAAARKAIERVVAATSTEIIVEAMWYTYSVADSWGRLGIEDEAMLSGLLDRPLVASAWVNKLQSPKEGPVSTIMSYSVRSTGLDAHLLEIAESTTSPSLRARAFRMMLEGQASWTVGWKWRWTNKPLGQRAREREFAHRALTVEYDSLGIMERAMSDRAIAVRRVAGDTLIARWPEFGDRAKEWAEKLALSDNTTLAERGAFVLRKMSEAANRLTD